MHTKASHCQMRRTWAINSLSLAYSLHTDGFDYSRYCVKINFSLCLSGGAIIERGSGGEGYFKTSVPKPKSLSIARWHS